MLGRRAQQDLVARALLDELADRRRGVCAAVDELDVRPWAARPTSSSASSGVQSGASGWRSGGTIN